MTFEIEPMVSISKRDFDKSIADAKVEIVKKIFEDIREKGKFDEPIVNYICLSFEELAEIEKEYMEEQT